VPGFNLRDRDRVEPKTLKSFESNENRCKSFCENKNFHEKFAKMIISGEKINTFFATEKIFENTLSEAKIFVKRNLTKMFSFSLFAKKAYEKF
jgi:hypothetical protein